MLFDVQPSSPIPIYEQVLAQVIFAVASGELQVGEMIPSVRELAARLMVHPNTVAHAFKRLSELGVAVSRHGKGMEVTAEAPALCRARRQDIVRARIREALREAATSQLPAEDVRRLVEEELARVNGKAKG